MKAEHLRVCLAMFRACADKNWFATKANALREQGWRLGQRAYKCRFCRGWHTTSRTGER